MKTNNQTIIEERFMQELRHHISGWRSKIDGDFNETNYEKELQKLQSDPVYSKFGFAIPEYVLIRLMGRVSISIGRRLGEIYDKIPRFVTAARFGLAVSDIIIKFGRLELDVGVRRDLLSPEDDAHVEQVTRKHFSDLPRDYGGLGIEIRYNFNPNDSARLRKDVDMAKLLKEAGFFPIYLIFSEISPRQEAIGRLTRAGWHFLVGREAESFMFDLIEMDFAEILDRPKIRAEIRQEIDSLMASMLSSEAFQRGAHLRG